MRCVRVRFQRIEKSLVSPHVRLPCRYKVYFRYKVNSYVLTGAVFSAEQTSTVDLSPLGPRQQPHSDAAADHRLHRHDPRIQSEEQRPADAAGHGGGGKDLGAAADDAAFAPCPDGRAEGRVSGDPRA